MTTLIHPPAAPVSDTLGPQWQMIVTIIILALAIAFVVIKAIKITKRRSRMSACDCHPADSASTPGRSKNGSACDGCPLSGNCSK